MGAKIKPGEKQQFGDYQLAREVNMVILMVDELQNSYRVYSIALALYL